MVIEIESDGGNRSIEEIAEDVATYIVKDGLSIKTLRTLLIEFAEEIKREAIEP